MKRVMFACSGEIQNDTLSCGSWIEAIALGLRSSFEIVFLARTPDDSGVTHRSVRVGGVPFSVHFAGAAPIPELVHSAVQMERPDVVVIFGTESDASHRFTDAMEQEGLLDHTVAFAQGFASIWAKHFTEGLPERVVRRNTVRDLIRRDGLRAQVRNFERRGEREIAMLKKVKHYIGRTEFDYAVLRLANPDCAYYKCSDVMRPAFYERQWTYGACVPHSIFVSQYYYPVKGFHYLLEAASYLKPKYPDLSIVAAGYNPIRKSFAQREWKDSSYIRYLKTLACRYGLQDCIHPIGPQSAEEMAKQYCLANVYAMPSTIENSPNSLAEAMLLGVPSVAADVGGVAELAAYGKEARVYPSSAPYLLAYHIDRVFADPKAAEQLGRNGRARALIEYDRETNWNALKHAFSAIAEA
jgi:glycosyltransferase involved in cell wall biosynthesis